MGFFSRIANLWRGFIGLFISNLESRNPEIVYEAAIAERVAKHRELKKAVSGIVYLRNKLSAELESKEAELNNVMAQLTAAVEQSEDEVALVLIEKKDELTDSIAHTAAELKKVSTQSEEAKASLIAFQAEIAKLKREKDKVLAKQANASARIQIQETLDGLSTDADIKALDNVREHVAKLEAEADIGSEIQGESLDAKLKAIRQKAGNSAAKSQLAEIKAQMAAKQAGAGQDGVKKTL